jgi:hypothetical protein
MIAMPLETVKGRDATMSRSELFAAAKRVFRSAIETKSQVIATGLVALQPHYA